MLILALGSLLSASDASSPPLAQHAATVAATPADGPSTPGVEAIVSMRDRPRQTSPAISAHKQSYDLQVDASSDWMDTGVVVAAGEQLTATATGMQTLSDGRVAGPDGLDHGWKDLLRQFPSKQARTGELIGRVSSVEASVPFALGAGGIVTMPTSGRLYLRSNVSEDLAPTGTLKVRLVFQQATAGTPIESASLPAIGTLVSAATFATVPRRVADEAGAPGDMVNFAMVGTEAQVKEAFAGAGWVAVDKSVGDALLHGLLSTLAHEAYTEMPMSTLFLFGRPQDLSFARGDAVTIAAERHHLRLWRTEQTVAGLPLWVGSATHDIGFERDQRNGNTTHKIDPKIDDERQFLLQSFDTTGAFTSAAYVTPANPMRKATTATGGSFFSDGRILVMQLR